MFRSFRLRGWVAWLRWGGCGWVGAWVMWLGAVRGASPGFVRLGPADTGLSFTNRLTPADVARNRLSEDGSGVALGDVDGDGLCDVYFCSLAGENRLFLNRGSLRFEDVTASAGVACPGQVSMGCVFADVDGDGDLDLWVTGLGAGTRLWMNDGRGRFTERTDSGLLRSGGARTMALADIDGDGDLDLYVTHYRAVSSKDDPQRVRLVRSGDRVNVPPEYRERFTAGVAGDGRVALVELGEPDGLYRNVGGGRFEAVSWTDGTFLTADGKALEEPPRDWGLCAMFRDLDGDGAPELYVCNDFYSPDRLWWNDGHGHFRESVPGVLRTVSWASMAVDFSDIDRDGRDDFFVADMQGATHRRRQVQRSNLETAALPQMGWGWHPGVWAQAVQVMRNTLFWNRGDGTFAEVARMAGVEATDWTWGVAFLDVDLDGYEDLLVANGHSRDHLNSDAQAALAAAPAARTVREREALFSKVPPLAVPKKAFRNRGGLSFEDVSARWGFDWTGVANGMALGDLDGDGDLDVVFNALNEAAVVLRNESKAGRVRVQLVGRSPNTHGIGARLEWDGGPVRQTQQVIAGGRYLSGDEGSRVFASGEGGGRLTVRWRGGGVSEVQVSGAGVVRVEEAAKGP